VEQFYPIVIALVFNVLDLLTGIISAVRMKDLQSSKLRDGLFKKVGFMICYFLAWLIDTYGTIVGFNLNVAILPIIVLYACTTELVSILENVAKINPDILPEKLTSLFHVADLKEDDNDVQ